MCKQECVSSRDKGKKNHKAAVAGKESRAITGLSATTVTDTQISLLDKSRDEINLNHIEADI